MRLEFTERHWFPVDRERLFDFTNDADNFVSFVGFGPIPGIRTATYETPGEPRVGSKRRIVETNGAEHLEEIVELQRPSRHNSRITGLAPPFSWLVRYAEDDWRFAPARSGTALERTFTFELTSPLAAVIGFPLLHLFMRPAVRRDLHNIEIAIASSARR